MQVKLYTVVVKQVLTAQYTVEAEYVAMSCATREVMGIRKLLMETGTVDGNHSCYKRVENKGCISHPQNQNRTGRTKQI